MSDANPFIESLRQLEYDVEELKADLGQISNPELIVLARGLIFEKQKLILALWKEYGGAEIVE